MTPQELRDWRKALDLTQEQAAHALGVTLRGYSKWEAGDSPIAERVDLAAQMYLRLHRTRFGAGGSPLLYIARVYESEEKRTPVQHYLVIARDQHEALHLTYKEIDTTQRAIIDVEAVADAPPQANSRIIGTIGEIARRKRVKWI